jgi:hypothetical protein
LPTGATSGGISVRCAFCLRLPASSARSAVRSSFAIESGF